MPEPQDFAADTASNQVIEKITVAGFKSIREEQSIEVRPLTLLAGKNSAGKSSIMQPILLLKQSLESPIDPPGGILLNGPNVKFTSANQLLSQERGSRQNSFQIRIHTSKVFPLLQYGRLDEYNLGIHDIGIAGASLRQGMKREEIYHAISSFFELLKKFNPKDSAQIPETPSLSNFPEVEVQRNRCFLELVIEKKRVPSGVDSIVEELLRLQIQKPGKKNISMHNAMILSYAMESSLEFIRTSLSKALTDLIHLPGLRGNPERQYPLTSWGETFPGTFEKYAASVLYGWQERKQLAVLRAVEADLAKLDLANHVRAHPKEGAAVEVQVKPGASGSEVVSLADVGLGVSQCLPVVVALHVAKPNQLVYLEQPEIHLHPRAQVALAGVLAGAVKRGVRMVVETHSDHLLLGIQTLVAEGKLKPDEVKLHWFQHDQEKRSTYIHSTDVDETGGFGSWPEDFSEVDMESRAAYLDAAAARRKKQAAPPTKRRRKA